MRRITEISKIPDNAVPFGCNHVTLIFIGFRLFKRTHRDDPVHAVHKGSYNGRTGTEDVRDHDNGFPVFVVLEKSR